MRRARAREIAKERENGQVKGEMKESNLVEWSVLIYTRKRTKASSGMKTPRDKFNLEGRTCLLIALLLH